MSTNCPILNYKQLNIKYKRFNRVSTIKKMNEKKKM